MKPFKRIYIEITNSCNLSCGFCPGTNRALHSMDDTSFETVLSRIGNFGSYLYYHVLGEPLLHPGLGNFLDIAQGHGKFVNLVTNGTLIREKGDALIGKPALRQITFSLHSFCQDKKEGSSDDYIRPILLFANKAKDFCYVSFRLWPARENADKKSFDSIVAAMQAFFNPAFSIAENLLSSFSVPITKNVFINQTAHFDWPDMTGKDFGPNGFCLGLREQIAILVDGTVVPCCLDRNGDMGLGNVFNEPFETILQKPRTLDIINGFSKRMVIEPLCRHCSYRKKFDR